MLTASTDALMIAESLRAVVASEFVPGIMAFKVPIYNIGGWYDALTFQPSASTPRSRPLTTDWVLV